ncbi:MAG: hypothetical protein ABIC40_02805 [bacterium]
MKPETGKDDRDGIIEFPSGSDRLPPNRLPGPLGKIAEGHPLKRPITIALIVLAIILIFSVVYGLVVKPPKENQNMSFPAGSYRESGAINYEEEKISGWFLDIEKQHFMADDGRRFTFVDSHEREGWPVSGHWRIVE